jgi:hypothetical protein
LKGYRRESDCPTLGLDYSEEARNNCVKTYNNNNNNNNKKS